MTSQSALLGYVEASSLPRSAYWFRTFLRRLSSAFIAEGGSVSYFDGLGVLPDVVGEALLAGMGDGILSMYDERNAQRRPIPTGLPDATTIGLGYSGLPLPGRVDAHVHAAFGVADTTARFEDAPQKHEDGIIALARSVAAADYVVVTSVAEGLHLRTLYGVAPSKILLHEARPKGVAERPVRLQAGPVVLHFPDTITTAGAAFASSFAREMSTMGLTEPVIATRQAIGIVRAEERSRRDDLIFADPLQSDELSALVRRSAVTVLAPSTRPRQDVLAAVLADGARVIAPQSDAFASALIDCPRYYPASAVAAAVTAFDVLKGAKGGPPAAPVSPESMRSPVPFSTFEAFLRDVAS